MRQGHGRNGMRGRRMSTGSTGIGSEPAIGNEPAIGSEPGGAAEAIRSQEVGRIGDLRYAVQVYLAGAQRDIARGVGRVEELRRTVTEVAVAFDAAIAQAESREGQAPAWQYEPLTKRERQVLQLKASASSTAEIADKLKITQDTVNKHLSNIRSKLGVHDTVASVIQGLRLGAIRPA